MSQIYIIMERELKSLFFSPLAWITLTLYSFVMAYLFLDQLDIYIQMQSKLNTMDDSPGVTQLLISPLYGNLAFILILVTPLLTMRTIAEEKKQNTLYLLLSSPVSLRSIIFGKFLAIVLLELIMVALISLMPVSLTLGSHLDWGLILSNIFGMILLICFYTACGIFCSALSKHASVGAITCFTILGFLWLLNGSYSQNINFASQLFYSFSSIAHFEPLLNGIVRVSDLFYFLALSLFFLSYAIRKLDSQRVLS